ncbi:MAG: GcrA family cell cycle regulator [Hyphomicrobiaceae bacterium]
MTRRRRPACPRRRSARRRIARSCALAPHNQLCCNAASAILRLAHQFCCNARTGRRTMTKPHQNKTLLELEAGECRWPVGDPRKEGFHFCWAQQVLGRPYCIQHWQMSFVPGKSRHSSPDKAQLTVTAVPQLAARKAA